MVPGGTLLSGEPGPPEWQAGSPDLPGLLGIFRSLQTFRERELQGSKPQGRQGPTGLPAEDFQLRREDVVQMGVVFRLLAAPLMSAERGHTIVWGGCELLGWHMGRVAPKGSAFADGSARGRRGHPERRHLWRRTLLSRRVTRKFVHRRGTCGSCGRPGDRMNFFSLAIDARRVAV